MKKSMKHRKLKKHPMREDDAKRRYQDELEGNYSGWK
jgi:hypothetical protein